MIVRLAILLWGSLLLASCGNRSIESPADSTDFHSSVDSVERIHPSFTFVSFSDPLFDDILPRSESGDRQAEILRFLNLSEAMLNLPGHVLLLVDRNHSLPREFEPPELIELTPHSGMDLNKAGMRLSRPAYEALAAMIASANREGLRFMISSAYRSYDYQKNLFENYVQTYGEDEASRFSARPGTSQHQLGTVVDFGNLNNEFAETAEGLWLSARAEEFGWSLSYPANAETRTGYQWESWHWRWIGTPAAQMQREFFRGSQQSMLEAWAKVVEPLSARYDPPS